MSDESERLDKTTLLFTVKKMVRENEFIGRYRCFDSGTLDPAAESRFKGHLPFRAAGLLNFMAVYVPMFDRAGKYWRIQSLA